MYPFGYGLSYSRFAYSDLRIKAETNGVRVTVLVKNTGDMDGDEVVQIYIKDTKSQFEVRNHRLAGFKRIHLRAGEEKETEIFISDKQFTVVNDKGERVKDGSEFILYAGGGQPDGRSEELTGQKPLESLIHY